MKLPIPAMISAFNYSINGQSDWDACLRSYGATERVIDHTNLICECFPLDACCYAMLLLIYMYLFLFQRNAFNQLKADMEKFQEEISLQLVSI